MGRSAYLVSVSFRREGAKLQSTAKMNGSRQWGHNTYPLFLNQSQRTGSVISCENSPIRSYEGEQFWEEPVSKPLEDGVQASELSEAFKQFRVVFPSRYQSAKVMQPANCAFDFIAADIASERTCGFDDADRSTRCRALRSPHGASRHRTLCRKAAAVELCRTRAHRREFRWHALH